MESISRLQDITAARSMPAIYPSTSLDILRQLSSISWHLGMTGLGFHGYHEAVFSLLYHPTFLYRDTKDCWAGGRQQQTTFLQSPIFRHILPFHSTLCSTGHFWHVLERVEKNSGASLFSTPSLPVISMTESILLSVATEPSRIRIG